MPESTINARFVGLDIGSSRARLFYKSPETDPRPLKFGDQVERLSLTGEEQGKSQSFLNANGFLRKSSVLDTISRNAIHRLGSGDEAAAAEIETIANAFADELRVEFSRLSLGGEEFPVSACYPSTWESGSPAITALGQAISRAGFPEPQMISDAEAAVQYHLFLNGLPEGASQRSFLVVDVGGIETRLAWVEWTAGGGLKLRGALKLDWGGDLLDEALFQASFATIWSLEEAPTPLQTVSLRLMIRELKEKLCQQINKGGDTATLNFPLPGAANPIVLTQAEFLAACQGDLERFSSLIEAANPEISLGAPQIDEVVLVGGSAGWYFVQDAVQKRWGAEKTWIFPEPALVTARGLALVKAGIHPGLRSEVTINTHPEPAAGAVASTGEADGVPPAGTPFDIPKPPPPPWVDPVQERLRLHKSSRKLILYIALAGAGFALLVSPIPFASFPVLMALEGYMAIKIASDYGYSLNSQLTIVMVLSLLGISLFLSFVIGEVIGLIPILGWCIKPFIAAGVIWGLGEIAIYVLDKNKFPELKR